MDNEPQREERLPCAEQVPWSMDAIVTQAEKEPIVGLPRRRQEPWPSILIFGGLALIVPGVILDRLGHTAVSPVDGGDADRVCGPLQPPLTALRPS